MKKLILSTFAFGLVSIVGCNNNEGVFKKNIKPSTVYILVDSIGELHHQKDALQDSIDILKNKNKEIKLEFFKFIDSLNKKKKIYSRSNWIISKTGAVYIDGGIFRGSNQFGNHNNMQINSYHQKGGQNAYQINNH